MCKHSCTAQEVKFSLSLGCSIKMAGECILTISLVSGASACTRCRAGSYSSSTGRCIRACVSYCRIVGLAGGYVSVVYWDLLLGVRREVMCSEHENLGLFRVGRCASFGQLGPVQVPPTPPHVLHVLQDHFGVAQVVDLVYFRRLQIKYEKSKYLLKKY